MNTTMRLSLLVSAALMALGATVHAQPAPPQAPNMTFFVVSAGPGKGADLGGLEGADRHCQTLAQAAGAGGKTWRGDFRTQAAGRGPTHKSPGPLGRGPCQNFKSEVVAQNVEDLHSDNNKLGMQISLTERGTIIPGVGYTPNRHDVLTGSQMVLFLSTNHWDGPSSPPFSAAQPSPGLSPRGRSSQRCG